MKNVTILLAVTAVLAFAAPAWAQAGFTDDFESYAPGSPLQAPYADWYTGVPPVLGTIVNSPGNGAGGSDQYLNFTDCWGANAYPVRWLTNPLEAQYRQVDIEFAYRGTTDDKFEAYMGWSDVPEGTPGPGSVYSPGNNTGVIAINGDIDSHSGGIPGEMTYTTYTPDGDVWEQVQSLPVILDGVTWNNIRIRLQVLSISGGQIRGQSQLFVNGVTMPGDPWNIGWDLPEVGGLNFVNIYGRIDNACLDNFNIVQSGFAIPGDANHDVTVNDSDLNLMLTGWNSGATPGTTWQEGDFNDDLVVNDSDLNLLLTNWTYPPAGSVPEPATIGLLAFGAIALVRRRRRA